MIHAAFRKGHLAEECTWQTVILISKGKRNYRGIGILEVLWKTVTGILNCLIMAAIQFHDNLHGI